MRKRAALGSFHLMTPLMIAATALPNAQMASKIPDSDSRPRASAKATVTIAIEPPATPKRHVDPHPAVIKNKRVQAVVLATTLLGGFFGSIAIVTVAFADINNGKPIATKIIPEITPAAGAIDVAHAVTMIGPRMNTTSSINASNE